ncbi:MAG: peptidoglycan glycosyltransferase FtsW [Planktomarina sp.]
MTVIMQGQHYDKVHAPIIPRWWRSVDRWTMAAVLMLFALGLILTLASSPPLAEKLNLSNPFHYSQRQAFFGALAIVAMIITSMMEPSTVRRWATIGFALAFVALALLPMFGTDFGKGATRWYSLGFVSVQPSEFLKPGFMVLGGWLLAATFDTGGPPGRFISFAIAVIITTFLALQPDFGQAALVLFGWGIMYFASGAPFILLFSMAGGTLVAGAFAYNNSEHLARRIDGFMAADVDPNSQLGFAADAIREGGIFGVGAGEGTVKWSLPDAHTDFIIAVAAEEYGVLMVLLILGLYGFIILRSLMRLIEERDMFIRLAGTGLVSIFAAQAMINMGVAVRLLPAKGMTLPFVSYGGSSLVAAGITLGMILSLTRKRPQGSLAQAMKDYQT